MYIQGITSHPSHPTDMCRFFIELIQMCAAATDELLWVNSLRSCTSASVHYEFRRFDWLQLDVELLRRTGHH